MGKVGGHYAHYILDVLLAFTLVFETGEPHDWTWYGLFPTAEAMCWAEVGKTCFARRGNS
jgi:hypothetical protein